MKKDINWSKGIFSNTFKIFSNNKTIGTLKAGCLSKEAKLNINEKNYLFKSNGFFNRETEIIEPANNTVIGNIVYNPWTFSGAITLNNRSFNFKYTNFWNTKWKFFNPNGSPVKFYGGCTKGAIESTLDDNLLMLAGVYIHNNTLKMAGVIAGFVGGLFIPWFS